VVVEVGIVRILGDGLVEIGQGLIVFQVVEVLVAFVDQTVTGVETRGEAKGREEGESQYFKYKSPSGKPL